MNSFAVAGVAAGVVSVVDGVPYIIDTLRGATSPHRGTWLIWSVLSIVALSSQIADGGLWSLVMVATQAALTTMIAALSIRRGTGALSRLEAFLLLVAGIGVIGWWVSSDPTVATVCVVIADVVGLSMMLPKTWRDPHSETLSTFALAGLAGALSGFAVGALNARLLIYPVYFCIGNTVLAVLISLRRRHVGRFPAAAVRPLP